MEFKDFINKIEVNKDWLGQYNDFVPQFIKAAETGVNWNEWDSVIFKEFFEKGEGQCISSLKQGYFTKVEQQNVKKNWMELAPLLQILAKNQNHLNTTTYEEIERFFRRFTTQNRKAATNRIIAALQPRLMCALVAEVRLKKLFSHLKDNFPNLNLPDYIPDDWCSNSNNLLTLLIKETGKDPMELPTYAWQLLDLFNNGKEDGSEPQKTKIMNGHDDTLDFEMDQEMQGLVKVLKYKKQIILQGPPGTGKTRMAKLIARAMLNESNVNSVNNSTHFKLIQFHPSYTYEDFVRGIQADTENGNISYKAVDKTLGKFAKEALQDYLDSKKEVQTLPDEIWVDKQLELFAGSIQATLKAGKPYPINEIVQVVEVKPGSLLYKGPEWTVDPFSLKLKDIKQAFLDNNKTRQNIEKNQNISGSARQHATYYFLILEKFRAFVKDKHPSVVNQVKEKPYILVIDEINRANLSAVLGELIYALEYRGEAVESVYAVDEDPKLILPPNLYIIGTMNTADRSVGQIDYAIRRRFAFIDVPPKDLSDEQGIEFDSVLFKEVQSLFFNDADKEQTVSKEFEPKDVALGHSYFISSEDASMDIRLKYEIKPILLEYVRDGILIGENIMKQIENLKARI